MTSRIVQLVTVPPGWLTVPVQVPPKAARPEGGGAADELAATGDVADGWGVGEPGCDRVAEGDGCGPGGDEVPGASWAAAAGCTRVRGPRADGPCAATACGLRCLMPGRAVRGNKAIPTANAATSSRTTGRPPTNVILGGFRWPWMSNTTTRGGLACAGVS